MRSLEGMLAINQPEQSERFARVFGIKGDLPNICDPLLQLGLTLDDLTAAEYWWLRRGRIFDAGSSAVATALNYGKVFLGAPQATDSLAIVERITIINQFAGQQAFRIGMVFSVASTANANQKTRDSRNGIAGRGAFVVNAALGVGNDLVNAASLVVNAPQQSTIVVEGPWIVSGQNNGGTQLSALMVETDGLNQAIAATFTWRERQMLVEER